MPVVRILFLLLCTGATLADQPLSFSSPKQLQEAERLTLEFPAQATETQGSLKPEVNEPEPYRVAQTVAINKAVSSHQFSTLNNLSYWRLELHAPAAKHLNLGFDSLQLPGSGQSDGQVTRKWAAL